MQRAYQPVQGLEVYEFNDLSNIETVILRHPGKHVGAICRFWETIVRITTGSRLILKQAAELLSKAHGF